MTNAVLAESPAALASAFAEELVRRGFLVPTGARGVWGRSADFEKIVAGVERLVDFEVRGDAARVVRFPPIVSREHFERSEFLKSFPHLAGVVYAFQGNGAEHQELLSRIESGGDWTELIDPTAVVLVPAACYPVYPAVAGTVPSDGVLFDVSSYCFRHEPSADPTRMIAFRMREHVRIGTPEQALAFRERWIERAGRLFDRLGVAARAAPASDPFFGRGGRLLALTQREQRLKFELLVPVVSDDCPTPVMSFNYHQDHFGRAFEIKTEDGATAHTACVGFGLERIALALIRTHGFELERWPAPVRELCEP